jgi:hypothetical protein
MFGGNILGKNMMRDYKHQGKTIEEAHIFTFSDSSGSGESK